MQSISGVQRLSVFLSLLWIGFWLVAFLLDGPPFNLGGFVLFAIVPPIVGIGIPWGVWWVAAGFRNKRKG